MSHEVKIAVQGEDLRLGVVTLDLNRQHRFLNFPPEAPLWGQKQVLAQLLGQRTSAFDHTARHKIFQSGPGNAIKIDSPMFVEILVFHRDNGVFDHLGNLVPRDNDPAFQRERANYLTVVSKNFRDEAGAVVFQRTHLRQIAVVDE